MLRLLAISAIFLFALSQCFSQLQLGFMQSLERLSQDLRLQQTMRIPDDLPVVIVDVDEASLQAFGQWPWSRTLLAQLTEQLFSQYQIKTLGFDMVFAEDSDAAWLAQLTAVEHQLTSAQVAHLQTQMATNTELAYSWLGRPVVAGFVFKSANDQPINALPPSLLELPADIAANADFIAAQSYTANLDSLQNSAAQSGFFDSPLVDDDGVFRQVALLQRFEQQLFASLALSVAQLALDGAPLDIEFDQYDDGRLAVNYLQLGRHIIKTGAHASVIVPYIGPQGSFTYLSAADVINGSADAALLQGKIVLLGTTAPGLLDLRATPVDKQMAGVEVHANVIAGMLQDRISFQPIWALAVELLTLFAIFALLTPLFYILRPLMAIVVTSAVLGLLISSNLYFWQQGLILPLANSVLNTALLFIVHMALGFVQESQHKRYISATFGQYVPPELAQQLSRRRQKIDLRGQHQELTVLFSDVRGFTHLSEQLDAQQLTQLMNELLTPLTRDIHQAQGTIDKYMGDAIMAFWGAPLANAQHAKLSIDAAFAMLASIELLNAQFADKNWPSIKVGIGINTGWMNVGNMGSQFRMAYTVLGDAVNLGSRIEGLTKFYGVDLLISEASCRAAPEYLCLLVDKVQVKGKDQAVKLYQPLCLLADATLEQQHAVALMERFFAAYCAQNQNEATSLLAQLAATHIGVNLVALYQQRLKDWQNQPPAADWQGVYEHQSK